MSRAKSASGTIRLIPAWRRRYPSVMAVARQSQPDQSVIKDMLKIKGPDDLTPLADPVTVRQNDPFGCLLPPVRRPHAEPAVAHLLIVDTRIIDLRRQAKNSG